MSNVEHHEVADASMKAEAAVELTQPTSEGEETTTINADVIELPEVSVTTAELVPETVQEAQANVDNEIELDESAPVGESNVDNEIEMVDEPENPNVKEYHIDGETAVDDVLFASLYASMDNQVLNVLSTLPNPGLQQNKSMSEALAAGNALLDSDDGGKDSDSDSGEDEKENMQPNAELIHDSDDNEEMGEVLKGSPDDMLKLFQLPEDLAVDVSKLPDKMEGKLRPIGVLLNEVEGMITVKSCTAEKVFELGSICALGTREIIGIIVDTIGPTASPFYILQKVKNVKCSPDETVFVDENLTRVAVVSEDIQEDYEEQTPTTAVSQRPTQEGQKAQARRRQKPRPPPRSNQHQSQPAPPQPPPQHAQHMTPMSQQMGPPMNAPPQHGQPMYYPQQITLAPQQMQMMGPGVMSGQPMVIQQGQQPMMMQNVMMVPQSHHMMAGQPMMQQTTQQQPQGLVQGYITSTGQLNYYPGQIQQQTFVANQTHSGFVGQYPGNVSCIAPDVYSGSYPHRQESNVKRPAPPPPPG